MFLQWGSTVYVPRMGKDPGRFARSEMSLRPTSPTLTPTRSTDQACPGPAARVASRQGPGQGGPFRGPFPPGSVALAHGASLHESACLGPARRQPCAQDHSEGPSAESAGSLSQTGNKGIINVTVSTVKTTSFLCVSCSYRSTALWGERSFTFYVYHFRDKCQSRSQGPLAGRSVGLFRLEEPPGPKKGPLVAVGQLGHRAENTPGFCGRSCDGQAQLGTDPPGWKSRHSGSPC